MDLQHKHPRDILNQFIGLKEWRSVPSGGMIYVSALDITLYIETENQLRNSEDKFALAFKCCLNYLP